MQLVSKILKAVGVAAIPGILIFSFLRDGSRNINLVGDYYREIKYDLGELSDIRKEIEKKFSIDREIHFQYDAYSFNKKFGITRLDNQIGNFYKSIKSLQNQRRLSKDNLADLGYADDQGRGAIKVMEDIYRVQMVPLENSRNVISQDPVVPSSAYFNNLKERGFTIVIDPNS